MRWDLLDLLYVCRSSFRLENVYAHVANEYGEGGVVGQDDPSVLPLSRKHVWFRPFELGSLSVKVWDG